MKEATKMEGKTNFSRRLYRLSGTGMVKKNHQTINFPITVSVFGNY